MTEAAVETGEERETTSRTARARGSIRNVDPFALGVLGLLAVPGHLVESLAFMQLFGLFFLFFLWPLVSPLFDLVRKRTVDDAVEPTDWIHVGSWREWAVVYLMIPVTILNPLVLVQDTLQLVGTGVAYVRHSLSVPAAGEFDQQGSYRLPVSGTWTVVNGSLEKEHSHSWFPVNQRYAYDLIVTDEDGRSRPEGAAPAVEEYYCYDEPVLAPADGVVVDVLDSDVEASRGGGFSHPLKRTITGNFVTIQHAPGEFSCLAHLVPGSVAVEPGDVVERGQEVARCGHSGNSSEPHLHLQFQDHPTFEVAAGLPVEFGGVSVESPWLEAADSTRVAADGGSERESDGTDTGASDSTDTGSTDSTDTGSTGSTDTGANAEPDERAPSESDEAVIAGQDGVPIAEPDGVPVAESDGVPVAESDGGATALTAGQRVTTVDPPIGEPVEHDAERLTLDRGRIVGLERTAFGSIVGGVLAFVTGLVASPSTVAVALAICALFGFGFWLVVRRGNWRRRPGGVGTSLGFALVAALWAGAPTFRSVATILLVGVGAYVLLAEYDRRHLGRAFDVRTRVDPGSDDGRSTES